MKQLLPNVSEQELRYFQVRLDLCAWISVPGL